MKKTINKSDHYREIITGLINNSLHNIPTKKNPVILIQNKQY